MSPRLSRWIALKSDRRGVAAVEMAIITTFFLLPLTAGMVGTGQALLTQYQVDRAMHAGMMYAWTAPGSTVAAIQQAAQQGYGSAASAAPAVTATASLACYCIPPTGTRASGTAIACTGTCTAPQVVATWATVNTSAAFTPIFTSTWGAAGWRLTATGTVRIK